MCLIAGATGYVGGLLADRLVADGGDGPLPGTRPPVLQSEARHRCEIVSGDVLDAATLEPALAGVDVAYYLVHSMGRGGDGGFAERDRRGARNFAAAAEAAGVERIVYLGGLGEGRRRICAPARRPPSGLARPASR